jgi:MoxR-like ATPase
MPNIQEFASAIITNVEKVIVGKRDTIELLLVALLCEGHVLIEDVPGVGKTMLARSMAVSIGGEFKRLQCTPDLLPNDVPEAFLGLAAHPIHRHSRGRSPRHLAHSESQY